MDLRCIIVVLMGLLSIGEIGAKDMLYTTVNPISIFLDGKRIIGAGEFRLDNEVEFCNVQAREIIFASDIDTTKFILDEWQSKDITIIYTEKRKQARIKITRIPQNIYENPNPQLLKRNINGLLSREQALFDIQALVFVLSEVHPDMFSVCNPVDFFRAINKTVGSLPDSISVVELYGKLAPIVSKIGDGHTDIKFPYNEAVAMDFKFIPLILDVLSDRTVICRNSYESIIPKEATVLNINNMDVKCLMDSMLSYVAGERDAFKLSRIEIGFPFLYSILCPTDTFNIEYLPLGAKLPITVKCKGVSARKLLSMSKGDKKESYTYFIDRNKNVAVMNFLQFSDVDKMKVFADSMFNKLRNEGIENLIIDLRYNGGGNSSVGDELLRYISPEPFVQFEKYITRFSPFAKKLIGNEYDIPGVFFKEVPVDEYIMPISNMEGHYKGNVYLLTSNRTYSSASAFAGAFKQFGMGKIIGEETGGMNVSFGDCISYRLPVSGLICDISYKRFWLPNADENDIHGIKPDISVPALEALDKAIEISTSM